MPGRAAARLAGEREYAFKHVLIRDVAYGMLPKRGPLREALRGRPLHRGARRRPHRRGRRAAGRALRPRRGARRGGRRSRTPRSSRSTEGAPLPRGRRRRRRARSTRTPRPSSTTRPCARLALPARPGDASRASPRSRATSRSGWAASTPRSRCGRSASSTTAAQEDLNRVADLHRKIGAGLWHKGERKQAIERYQKGINLLKDGPPCLELVRLYEEAASLYMHAGDNMLAIYASEKALRLAERLGETRAASRAHGIFGRVFGRIGDTEKARENLERSVELARDSDEGETIRALLTLGHHLEVSEADYDGAGTGLRRGARSSPQQIGDLPAQVELQSSLAQLAVYRADWDEVETRRRGERRPGRARGPGGQALLSATCCAACWPGATAAGTTREQWLPARARAGRAGRLVGGRVRGAVLARPHAARPRRLHGGGHRARPRARRLRAGRADRAVDRGDVGAGDHACDGGQGRAGAARTPRRPGDLAERLHYPVGQAAALKARGTTAEDPDEGLRMLREARELWEGLGRPLDAAISRPAARATPCAEPAPGRGARRARARGDGSSSALGVAHLSDWAEGARLGPACGCRLAQLPDGVEIHWEERGEGPLVVIANQFFGEAWVFEGLTALLAEDHRVVTYDLRGTGRSSRQGPVRHRDRRARSRGTGRGARRAGRRWSAWATDPTGRCRPRPRGRTWSTPSSAPAGNPVGATAVGGHRRPGRLGLRPGGADRR